MRIAIASILQESNTFSPVMTAYHDFQPVFGKDVIRRHRGKLTEMGGFLDVLEHQGAMARPVCAAWAITANRLVGPDFERLQLEFREALRRAGKVDGVLLAMHGAQTAEGVDDVEGRLLEITREAAGERVPVVASLDLHANITRAMVERATALVGYHTYPHIDMFETGQKAARLLLRIIKGECHPVTAWRKLPLIVNAENSQTSRGPMARLIGRGERLEKSGGVEAVSVFPVQPWLDIEEMGSAVVVVSNGKVEAAERAAAEIAKKFWDTRREFDVKLETVHRALREAEQVRDGLVVLAESSDSTGSGSPGDSTGVLKHLLKARLSRPAAIFLVDPEAVAELVRAGVGATVRLAIGGKFDRANSQPVEVAGRVRLISDGRWTPRHRGYNTGIETDLGTSAVLEVGWVRVLIASKPAMTVDPELFRSHGIDPAHCQVVVVKSPNGFRAAYEPLAKKIFLVDTPGVSTARLERLPWKKVSGVWPLDRRVGYEGWRGHC